MTRLHCFIASMMLALAGLGLAQEYRATLLGTVTDPAGAAVPAAKVVVTNIGTGVTATARANETGNYVVPFLNPGIYRLRVEHAGMKTFERSPIELRTNDRVRVDVPLVVGEVSERVTVAGEAPLLETSTASMGQVIDNRKIVDLPTAFHNPIRFLIQLAPGIQYTSTLSAGRPYAQASMAGFSFNGGRSGLNEYQIDGVPNNANTGSQETVAYVPPVEATQEMKVQTNTYDAQYGRTGGGVVTLAMKSGTNRLHGAAYEYARRTGLNANQFVNNANNSPRNANVVDQWGFQVDGPVVLPKLYNGRNRTFFMFSMEIMPEWKPDPILGGVPTTEQRNGDFSQTLRNNGALYTVYDPLTIQPNPAFDRTRPVTLSNLQFLRSPFSGNKVPMSRMNPVALRVLKDIPLPNQDGDRFTHLNNWFAGDSAQVGDFKNFVARVDHTIGSNWKTYARWVYSNWDNDVASDEWRTPASRASVTTRRSDGAVLDVVGSLTPRSVLNGRFGFTRYEGGGRRAVPGGSDLGFPPSLLAQLQLPEGYPVFTFENYLTAGLSEPSVTPTESFSLQGNVLITAGVHSAKFGGEYRKMRRATLIRTNASGAYAFNRGWTSSTPQLNDAASGNAIASFLLGYMSAASANLNATPYWVNNYPVLFFHDDWQVSRRLTLNLGLRWDLEGPPVERYNQQNRGFDFSAKSPYQVPGLDLRGGLLFAGSGGQPRGAFDAYFNNWQPRFGLAYKVLASRPLVFRTGFGRYYLPTVEAGGTVGFTQVTSAEVSTPDFLPSGTLSNPFPLGLIRPSGSALGLATQVGDSLSFSDPRRRIPNVWQYSAGFQYEIRTGMLAEISYVGSRSYDLQVTRSLNFLTTDQLALGTPYLNQVIPNPFYGVLPATTSRGSQPTIQRRNLIIQYPHYSGLTLNNESAGRSWYNSLQVKIEQRFKSGLSYIATYTNGKTMEAASYLNPQDTALERRLVSWDVSQRVTFGVIYEMPVGPGKRWVNSGALARVVGGWQFNWLGGIETGPPMPLPDFYMAGDPKLKSGQTFDRWFNTARDIWIQRPADTLRVTPSVSSNIRRHSAPQFDTVLIRDFKVCEGHKFQFKLAAYNTFNSPIFSFPDTNPVSPRFGMLNPNQLNNPRNLELGFRYVF